MTVKHDYSEEDCGIFATDASGGERGGSGSWRSLDDDVEALSTMSDYIAYVEKKLAEKKK